MTFQALPNEWFTELTRAEAKLTRHPEGYLVEPYEVFISDGSAIGYTHAVVKDLTDALMLCEFWCGLIRRFDPDPRPKFINVSYGVSA